MSIFVLEQRTLNYFVRGNITVRLTSRLTGLDLAVLLNWKYKQNCLFGQILTGLTGGQPYSDISPYKVNKYFCVGDSLQILIPLHSFKLQC